MHTHCYDMPKVRVRRRDYSVHEVLAVMQDRCDELKRLLRTTHDERDRVFIAGRIAEEEHMLDNLTDLIDEMRVIDMCA